MICKKCGANIADTSKFCGYCGGKVEEILGTIPEQNPINQQDNTVLEQNTVNQNVSNNMQFEQNLNQIEQRVNEQTVAVSSINQQEPIHPNATEPKNKKSKALIFIVGGILLGIVAIILLVLAFTKSSNNSIDVLEKALNNVVEQGENSGTITARLLMESATQDSYNLSADIKYAKKSDNYDISLTLNKSMLYEEMNFYSTITEDNMTLYAKSSLVDMLGMTSSSTDMWLYYLMPLDELEIEESVETNDKISLSEILDENHYKYIDEQDGLRHYQLIIDNTLINNMKSKLTSEELEEVETSLDSLTGGQTELTDTYYIDFYINKSNELAKVSMDLTKLIDDESVANMVVSFEFTNFGNTSVEIPSDAKSSTMDLEKYISSYTSQFESYDYTAQDTDFGSFDYTTPDTDFGF